MLLYHLGTRRPQPRPFIAGEGCCRQHDDIDGMGAFFGPYVDQLRSYLGTDRTPRIYVYEVPRSVIKACGGLRWHYGCCEVFITEDKWHEIKFLGSHELPRQILKKDRGDKMRHHMVQKLGMAFYTR